MAISDPARQSGPHPPTIRVLGLRSLPDTK